MASVGHYDVWCGVDLIEFACTVNGDVFSSIFFKYHCICSHVHWIRLMELWWSVRRLESGVCVCGQHNNI